MKILIIATWFSPDTAVAAVRPYMLAKYLSNMGHGVTVLRSGALNRQFDNSLPLDCLNIRVISYLGPNSPAEIYAKTKKYEIAKRKQRFLFLPKPIRAFLIKCYSAFNKLFVFKKYYNGCLTRFESLKETLDKMRQEHFDVVFSTYGEMENIWGGQYAAKLFNCKYIQDYRDPVVVKGKQRGREYGIRKKVNEQSLNSADAYTTVSVDVAKIMQKIANNHVYTLYNGYDIITTEEQQESRKAGKLRLCYTGAIYKSHSFKPLFKAMSELCKAGIAHTEDFAVDYAGSHFAAIENDARQFGMEKVLVNHGYVSREEAYKMQKESDIFVVASWNTKYDVGLISGKFYEGIRSKMPILTLVAGKIPNSELLRMNKKYNYGFCYEEAAGEKSYKELVEYLAGAIQAKRAGDTVPYCPKEELFVDFRYDTLSKRLEGIMLDLVNNK